MRVFRMEPATFDEIPIEYIIVDPKHRCILVCKSTPWHVFWDFDKHGHKLQSLISHDMSHSHPLLSIILLQVLKNVYVYKYFARIQNYWWGRGISTPISTVTPPLRVEFLLKTDSGYPKDTGVNKPWQPLGIPFAITPIGQLHQSPPSPIPGDLGRGPSHQSHVLEHRDTYGQAQVCSKGHPGSSVDRPCQPSFHWIRFWHVRNPLPQSIRLRLFVSTRMNSMKCLVNWIPLRTCSFK